jgi:hypothetical protein
LDVYLGWIYNKSEQQTRMKKGFIIALWNDRKLREFAANAIDYYLNAHPSYGGWRVSNPRQLPRRRRQF